jgi:hypothetical protein
LQQGLLVAAVWRSAASVSCSSWGSAGGGYDPTVASAEMRMNSRRDKFPFLLHFFFLPDIFIVIL